MYKCIESCAAVWENFALCLVFYSGLSICKVALFRGQLSQSFFEIFLVGMSFAVQMNRIDCLVSLHSRFFASCSSVKSFPLIRIMRSLHASSLVAIRLLYLNWISFSWNYLAAQSVQDLLSPVLQIHTCCSLQCALAFTALWSRFRSVVLIQRLPRLAWLTLLMPCVSFSLSYIGCRKISMQVFIIGRINSIFCYVMHGFIGVKSYLLLKT